MCRISECARHLRCNAAAHLIRFFVRVPTDLHSMFDTVHINPTRFGLSGARCVFDKRQQRIYLGVIAKQFQFGFVDHRLAKLHRITLFLGVERTQQALGCRDI